jgi:protein O-mannosyl-transferase
MKSKKPIEKNPVKSSGTTSVATSSILAKHFYWHPLIVFIIGILSYTNTINHGYTQDDAIVIYDNMYTKQGFKGLAGLFTKDTFFGFFKTEGKANLVKGGRYRPMTPAMFAIEYKLAGGKPWLGHLINIMLYGLLCWVLYKFLASLVLYKEDSESKRYLVLITALLYAVHPIHTEAVANIKGRDEIMAMLGSIMAAWMTVRYFDTKRIGLLVVGAISFFVGILSKENTITFLAVVPLCLYYFRDINLSSAISRGLYLVIPAALFLVIRFAILGNDFGDEPQELMNNPYLKIVNGNYVALSGLERFATIMYTLSKYIVLLIFPHPLTNDYYPRHIGVMTMSDPGVLLSILLYIILIALAIWGLARKHILGFGAAYFMITLSIVSNIVFPIGTNMSERFMFMPSLGIVIMVAYSLVEYVYKNLGQSALIIVSSIILLAGIGKTFMRNQVWVDDYTLFTTDVKVSKNSAKAQNAAGGTLTTAAATEQDPTKKKAMLQQAVGHLNQSVKIHPTYKNPYLILGNAHYYLGEYEKAITAYENALAIDPGFGDASKNLAVALRDAGKIAGEKEGNLPKALSYLQRSLTIFDKDVETLRLLGVANGVSNNHPMALGYFEKVVQIDPTNATGFLNLSNALRNVGQTAQAEQMLQKALSLDANVLKNNGRQ